MRLRGPSVDTPSAPLVYPRSAIQGIAQIPFPHEITATILEYLASRQIAESANPNACQQYYSNLSRELKDLGLTERFSKAPQPEIFCIETIIKMKKIAKEIGLTPEEIGSEDSLDIGPFAKKVIANQDLIAFFCAVLSQIREDYRPHFEEMNLLQKGEAIRVFMNTESNWFLRQIVYLDFSAQKISEIPVEIKKLVFLQGIFLGKNRPKKLPESIARLYYLNEIAFIRNPNEEFPESIGDLPLSQILRRSGMVIYRKPIEWLF